MQIPDIPVGGTPIYQANNARLSPREMWRPDKPEAPQSVLPKPVTEIEKSFAEDNRDNFKTLPDDMKNIMCAGIVLSANYRKFLKPYLQQFLNQPRKKVMSQEDQFEILNTNAVEAFVTELLSTLEARARRSPSYSTPLDND